MLGALFGLVILDGAIAYSIRRKYGRGERYFKYETVSCFVNALVFGGLFAFGENAGWLEALFLIYAVSQLFGFFYASKRGVENEQ